MLFESGVVPIRFELIFDHLVDFWQRSSKFQWKAGKTKLRERVGGFSHSNGKKYFPLSKRDALMGFFFFSRPGI